MAVSISMESLCFLILYVLLLLLLLNEDEFVLVAEVDEMNEIMRMDVVYWCLVSLIDSKEEE